MSVFFQLLSITREDDSRASSRYRPSSAAPATPSESDSFTHLRLILDSVERQPLIQKQLQDALNEIAELKESKATINQHLAVTTQQLEGAREEIAGFERKLQEQAEAFKEREDSLGEHLEVIVHNEITQQEKYKADVQALEAKFVQENEQLRAQLLAQAQHTATMEALSPRASSSGLKEAHDLIRLQQSQLKSTTRMLECFRAMAITHVQMKDFVSQQLRK